MGLVRICDKCGTYIYSDFYTLRFEKTIMTSKEEFTSVPVEGGLDFCLTCFLNLIKNTPITEASVREIEWKG